MSPDAAHPADPADPGDCPIRGVEVTAYEVPTDAPEADGTIAWNSTTLVLVQVHAGDETGTGWTYGTPALVPLVRDHLASEIKGHDAMATTGLWQRMVRALRNVGARGPGAMAVSAVDCALWDLKARLLRMPLHRLLGVEQGCVPLYGSGGFTTYDEQQLTDQLRGWVEHDGMTRVKIKIGESWGTCVDRDLRRVRQARDVIGPDVELFVDANGGYLVGQAVRVGQRLDDLDVRWFEEPVSSDDLTGLRHVRRHTRSDTAAGEYCDGIDYAARMCAADAVDCLQVDVTRCGGITGLLRIAAVARAAHLDISGHCAPYEHASVLPAISNLAHLEYFHDHVRIEQLLFTGAAPPVEGQLRLDEHAAGNGLAWNPAAAEPFRVA